MESSRPLACDFRRLRFSRNARFSRSCRGSFAGFFAGSLAWPPPLAFSSVIVDLWHDRENAPIGETHALAPLPQRTLEGRHRFFACGVRDLPARPLSVHIVFHSPFVQAPIPWGPCDPADADNRGADFREFQLTPQLHRQLPRRRAGTSRNMAGARRGNGEPERAATGPVGGVHGRSTLIFAVFAGWRAGPPACADRGLMARIGALCGGLFGRFSSPGHAAVAQW